MPNLRLVLEYNGAGFHGWQEQPGLRTIQSELTRALKLVTREEIGHIQPSGRTDAGVHAKAQVANVHLEKEFDLFVLKHAVSSILRGEVSILEADYVSDDFDARRDAVSKEYRYTIVNRPAPPTIERGRVWHIARQLDRDRMAREALALVGEHDFTSFRGANCAARTPVKTIFESELIWTPPHLIYRVVGTGFLKQMVRIIVGTLVAFGKDEARAPSMAYLMRAGDRNLAGITAPAFGLCLERVNYP